MSKDVTSVGQSVGWLVGRSVGRSVIITLKGSMSQTEQLFKEKWKYGLNKSGVSYFCRTNPFKALEFTTKQQS